MRLFMTRLLKHCGWLLLLSFGLESASGFALLGPKEAFQTAALGYNRLTELDYPATSWLILSGPEFTYAPKNLGEEYRWSVPVLYYTYDTSFLDYFAADGVQAVDSAFAIFNSLTNVSSYTSDLS